MSLFYLEERDFDSFVDTLVQVTRVVGPIAKRQKFVFGELTSAEDLRLDYDVTILPPKKVFFPPKQEIARFDADSVSGCIEPVDTVLLGVHHYDVRGIDMTDFLFRERNEDWNYLAQREATTIVASNVQSLAPRAFWASMLDRKAPQGHDAFLTKIDGGYVFETRTPKGKALLAHGAFRDATSDQIAAAETVNASVLGQCQDNCRIRVPRSPRRCASRLATKRCGTNSRWTASAAVRATSCAPRATASTCATRGTSTRSRVRGPATGTRASPAIRGDLDAWRPEGELPRTPPVALPPQVHAQGRLPQREARQSGVHGMRAMLDRVHGRHRRSGPRHHYHHGVVLMPNETSRRVNLTSASAATTRASSCRVRPRSSTRTSPPAPRSTSRFSSPTARRSSSSQARSSKSA